MSDKAPEGKSKKEILDALKKEGLKTLQRFQTGKLLIIQGIYWKIIGMQPKQRIMVLQLLSQKEFDDLLAAQQKKEAASGSNQNGASVPPATPPGA